MADELQRQGQTVLRKAGGNGHRWLPRNVKRLPRLARIKPGAGVRVVDAASGVEAGGRQGCVEAREHLKGPAREPAPEPLGVDVVGGAHGGPVEDALAGEMAVVARPLRQPAAVDGKRLA